LKIIRNFRLILSGNQHCHTLFLKKEAVPRDKIIETVITQRLLFDKTRNITYTTTILNPTMGRYSRCSNNASLMGIILDSTESVMKNQKIPKETTTCFFINPIDSTTIPAIHEKAKGV